MRLAYGLLVGLHTLQVGQITLKRPAAETPAMSGSVWFGVWVVYLTVSATQLPPNLMVDKRRYFSARGREHKYF